ncbi:hypothetical protein, partial [Vibrio navarrensis]|uniref:hypothetical protein n=1 Tax=Vibrio navarrensis TaxID=29495 RepID=UPI001F3F937E
HLPQRAIRLAFFAHFNVKQYFSLAAVNAHNLNSLHTNKPKQSITYKPHQYGDGFIYRNYFYKNIKRESHAEKNLTGGNRQRTERLWW